MGYYMYQVGCDFGIHAGKIQNVIEAIKEVAEDTPECYGLDMDIIRNGTTIQKIMEEFGWSPTIDYDGCVDGINFIAEKMGDDERLFEAIAPFVNEGSYIQMYGGDNDQWKWKFVNGKCIRKGLKLVEED